MKRNIAGKLILGIMMMIITIGTAAAQNAPEFSMDVAVDYASLVGIVEGVAQIEVVADGLLDAQNASSLVQPLQASVQCLAGQELLNHVVLAVVVAVIEYLDDVRVPQLGDGHGLALKAA